MKKIALALTLCGCTTNSLFPGYIPFDLTNRASLPFSVENTSYQGTAVLQRKSSQTINFTIPKGTVKFMITTCSREEFFAYPDSSKPFKYIYVPVMYLENLESCLMKVTAITDKGETVTGLIDFTAGEELEGELSCNGKVIKSDGVGLCQSRKELIQNIQFKEETVFAAGKGCPDPVPGYISTSYNITLKAGFCTYQFMNKDKKIYRLTTYGYETIEEVRVK
jgi:hypothetical protein